MLIRQERHTDIDTIFRITQAAFEDHPFSDHKEQLIVNALRAAKAMTLSLVAQWDDEDVVGHVAFSPVEISDGRERWYGLGPVSVAPAYQRRGIGKALIRHGLQHLQSAGAQGCVVMGDPDYYQYFGFRHLPELVYQDVPAEYFLALAFCQPTPQGFVTYHPAFFVQE
jgi:putative acetyltransferase